MDSPPLSLFARLACALGLSALATLAPAGRAAAAALPRPAHVVVVVEENRSLAQVLGYRGAPYINSLFASGATFTNSHGVTHPSLPNYFALFSGLTNDNGDGCPATGLSSAAANLGSELRAAGLSFTGYSEALPSPGWTGCAAGRYGRKHAPWVHFKNLPPATNQPFSAFPRYDALPTLSFVIPDIVDDMHDAPVEVGDAWLAHNVAPLVAWAAKHDTLLVLTWDEGYDLDNTIPTVFVGPMVKAGRYAERVTHYRVLRTLEDLYSLPHAGRSAGVEPLTDCWR
jgi:phosphatidylinositol-3-phosphatase